MGRARLASALALRRSVNPLGGHFWTIAPVAQALLRAPDVSPSRPWRTELEDPDVGTVRLSGALHVPNADTDTLLVALHGLGGDIESHYIRRIAMTAHRMGAACLRLNMRGADMSGDDFYHAGLTADLASALASQEVARFRRVVLVGYSIGGHIVLRYATEQIDPRVSAVAAVCPPLDLARSVRDIDQRLRWPYRRHVLGSMREMLRAVGRRRALPVPLTEALRIGRLRHWDETLVAPRFGFRGAHDYYQKMSVARRFDRLRVPALIIGSRHDPMVLQSSIARALPKRASELLEVRWLERAGHVGFPADIGFERQVLEWLTSR